MLIIENYMLHEYENLNNLDIIQDRIKNKKDDLSVF